MKMHQSHSFFLRVLAAATASAAPASSSAAESGALPDVTVAIHATHYVLAGRAYEDPEQLGTAIDAMNPRSIGVDACGPGTTRPLMAAAYRLRARPLYLRAHESDAAACAKHGAAARTVSLQALRIDDEAAVDRYWRSIAP